MSIRARKPRRGVALVLVLVFAGAVGAISVGMLIVSRNQALSSQARLRDIAARNAADGMMHAGVMMVRRNPYYRGTLPINDYAGPTGITGQMSVTTHSDGRILVSGTGNYQGASRTSTVLITPAQLGL